MSMNTEKLSIHSNYLHKYLHNNYIFQQTNISFFVYQCIHGSQTFHSSLSIEALDFPSLTEKITTNVDFIYVL